MATNTHSCCHADRPDTAGPDDAVVTSARVREALQAIKNAAALADSSEWTPEENRVRVALLQLYRAHGRAPLLTDLAARVGLSVSELRPLLASLQARDAIVLDPTKGEIVGAYPFTERATEHQVSLGGVTLRAMCAIDALGIGSMYDEDVAIRSHCRHCSMPIEIATTDRGRAIALCRPTTAVVWSSARYEHACAANSLCTEIAFFCSDAHLQRWRDNRSHDSPGFRLSMDEALEAGRAIFGQSLRANIEALDTR